MYMYILYIYMYNIYNTYDNQIAHRNPSFNLLILYNNSFVNQGSEINKKNKIILNFDILSFTNNVFPTTHLIHSNSIICITETRNSRPEN